MQLERFDGFVTEVHSDYPIAQACLEVTVYRYFDDKWYDERNEIVSQDALLKNLSVTRRRAVDWRHKGDICSYLPVKELDVVAVVRFEKPANGSTRRRVAAHLDRCFRNSKNAFDATHDSLTGLLNRGGFEAKLLAVVNDCLLASSTLPIAASKLQASELVGLLAFDIDHFKQVNDSHGHQYGDVVLQCFARRLDKTSDSIMRESAEKMRLSIARPGGEEFAVIVEGANSVEQLQDIAERFRIAVSEQVLPSEQEWTAVVQAPALDIPLPHIAERRITVSIGIASSAPTSTTSTSRPLVSTLIHHADTALYRAKIGGRNAVRNFSDILPKHGRILEHHESTGIVTIDIGALVGVSIGQEFAVYHPDFSGGVPFLYRDGRTEKRLGDYPKVHCGRLVVFNVQNEISFCKIAHRECSTNFLPGSVLEAIPIGSLSHLLAFDSQFTASIPDLVPADKLPDTVKSILTSGAKPLVAVFTVKDASDVTKKRGQVFINQCLTKMYQTIREKFDFHTSLGQIQSSSVAVVCDCGDDSKDDIAKVAEVIEALNASFHGQVTFVAGIFDPNEIDEEFGSKYDRAFALEFARYAASEEEHETTDYVQTFTGNVASNVVYMSRAKRAYQAALADYHRFVEHGVANPWLENHAALCEVERVDGDYQAGAASISRAIALKDSVPDFYANKAYIEYFKGDLEATLSAYRKCWEVKGNYQLSDVYRPSYAKSLAHELLTKGGGAEDVKTAIDTIDGAMTYLRKQNRTMLWTELHKSRIAIAADPRFKSLIKLPVTDPPPIPQRQSETKA